MLIAAPRSHSRTSRVGHKQTALVSGFSPAARWHFRSVGPLDQAAHLRLGHRLVLRRLGVEIQEQRPKDQDLGQRKLAGVHARTHSARPHSARRSPAPRARSSSKANSASETFLPTDFVPYRLILYGAVGSVSTAWESHWEEVAGFACGSPGRTIGGRRRAKGLRLNRFPYSLVGSLPGPSAWRKIVHRRAPEPTTSRLKIATP
jgi:hypothetical protein